MECPRCQHENPAGQKFCGECGAPLSASCPSCGVSGSFSQKFCRECGTALAVVAAEAPPPSPGSYMPKHLAERILSSKAALEGERKQVTVLFADLKGSMELLVERDPEEARKLLDPVLKHMMEAVHRYEGTVNQVMGDGIMALFGAPLAHEDHAIRACYAALRMQESVKRYAEGVFRAYGVPVRIRVGLNSGDVIVRAIGSDLHMDYSAIGQTTHLAARMEQIADPGTIRLTAETLHLAEGFVQVRGLGPTPVKGLATPIEVFELTAASSIRSRLQATAARGLTKFVGRDSEMDALCSALGRAQTGHGQVVAVVGEPGVGKSRLYWEFTRSHRTHSCLILEAPSVSYGKATTYLPVIELLKRYVGIEPRDDGRKIRERMTGKLLSLDRALEPFLSPLLWLLDAPVEDATWERLDPLLRRQRLRDAIRHVLLRETREQPVILVFEDLHWIDEETQALLDGLVDSLPAIRLLLLVNYRPEYRHGWGSKTYYAQLRLDTLPSASATELLEALLGTHASVQPLVPVLITRTEGNPFFLEETVQTLAETGALAGERGAYRLVGTSGSLSIPATAQAILSARIDRLPSEEKELLQTAAVIGKDLPFTLLQAIVEGPEPALRRGLEHLQAAEFVYETSVFPDLEYTFKHALTHELAYASLLEDRRRALHAKIVVALERLYPDRRSEQVDRLAHHAVAAGMWEPAVGYLRQAGAKALGHSAHRNAVAHFRKALDVLGRWPDSRERTGLAIDLRFDLRTAMLPLGELEPILTYLQEADALATTLGDRRRMGQLAVYMTGQFYLMGELARALEVGHRAVTIAEGTDDFGLRVATNAYVGQIYYVLGDYGRAADFFRRNVMALVDTAIRERFGLPQLPSVHSRTCLVWALAERGDFADAGQVGHDALVIAESIGDPLHIVVACAGLGVLRARQGEWIAAMEALERAMRLIRESHMALWLPRVGSTLGAVYAALGRLDEATSLLHEAVSQAAVMRLVSGRSLLLTALGDTHLRARRVPEAEELGASALQLARDHGERGHEAWALKLCGEVRLRRPSAEVETAARVLRQALAQSETLGMRPLAAQTHLLLAESEARLGRKAEAAEHLGAAIARFADMGMTWWLARAEAEAAALR